MFTLKFWKRLFLTTSACLLFVSVFSIMALTMGLAATLVILLMATCVAVFAHSNQEPDRPEITYAGLSDQDLFEFDEYSIELATERLEAKSPEFKTAMTAIRNTSKYVWSLFERLAQ